MKIKTIIEGTTDENGYVYHDDLEWGKYVIILKPEEEEDEAESSN